MWFKADDEFAWYDGASNAVKMKLDANGDLQRPYGIYARGYWNFVAQAQSIADSSNL